MMRNLKLLLATTALLLLPCAVSAADDYYDCRLTCAAERETRNMSCPSPYDVVDGGQERLQCMKENQDAYNDCLKRCPTPPPSQPAPEGEAPPMAY